MSGASFNYHLSPFNIYSLSASKISGTFTGYFDSKKQLQDFEGQTISLKEVKSIP